MASKEVYFGTRAMSTWIPAYDSAPTTAVEGWSDTAQFLNGGKATRNSVSGAKMYELTWSLKNSDDLRVISDFRAGLFGQGLIYWLDPMAMAKNVLPQHLASPFQQGYDAPPMRGTKVTLQPTAVNVLRYPVETAVFQTSTAKREVYIPIPPGYVAWVGVHGPVAGGTVTVTPALTETNSAATVAISKLAVTSTTRVNTQFSGDTYRGLIFGVQDGAQYTGAMCQILPAGVVPATGNFISGQGNSGCSFSGGVSETPYSSVLDKVGMSAKLEEVGAWL